MKKPTSLRAQASIIAASIVSAAGLAGADDAKAGSYPMYACDVPGVYLASPTKAAWRYYDNAGQVAHNDTCVTQPNRGGAYSFQINYPTGVLQQNGGVGLELEIPATGPQSAISIERVVDWTETQLTAMGPGQAPAWGLNLGATVGTAPGGSSSGFDGTGTTGAGHDSGPLPGGTRTRRLGVLCSYMGGGYGNCTLPSPFLRIRGLKTTLREDVQPTASIDGGTLASPGAHTGTKTVTYSAADGESGVERVEVLLDGVVVAKASDARDLSRQVIQQTGDCEYVDLRACPATTSGTLSVNTAGVPDGAYALEVRATDAAGNSRSAVYGQPVVIDNVPDTVLMPPAPTQGAVGGATRVTTTPPSPASTAPDNGVGASSNATSARRSPRPGGASSRAATARRCSSPGAQATGRDAHRGRQAPRAAPGQDVRGGDGAGRGDHDGLRGHVPPRHDRGPVAHDPHRLPRPSRRHGVRGDDRHRARRDRAGGAATDRAALRNGQTVKFRGSVAGAPQDSRKVVELQVRKGKSWMTFRSTRLRNGRFSESYKFTRTVGTAKYVFRARVRAEAGFPFNTGQSKQVRVTVRG